MSFRIDVDDEATLSALRSLPEKAEKTIARGAAQSARELEDSIKNDWLNRQGSGIRYASRRSGKSLSEGAPVHVASAPGEPPAPDTNTYRRRWQSRKEKPLLWRVFNNMRTGRHLLGQILEFGTRLMAARPHVGPAAKEHAARHLKLIRAAIKKATSRL